MLSLGLEFQNLDKELRDGILGEIRLIVIKSMDGIIRSMKPQMSTLIETSIKASDEYASLNQGILRAELGIQDPSVVDVIIDRWASNIEIKFRTRGEIGVIEIGMIQSNYSDVLTLPEASYAYSTRKSNGIIEWLRWLLLEGNKPIVFDYDFRSSGRGRTGLGFMAIVPGSNWSVPSQFAGTSTDNFVTRALQNIDKQIVPIIEKELIRGLKDGT